MANIPRMRRRETFLGRETSMDGEVERGAKRDSVREICARLHRARLAVKLYPPGHPTVNQALEALHQACVLHLKQWGPMAIEVEENRLVYEGEEVYTHSESRQNVAFLLFRDGIRLVEFKPELEATELAALVNCLARADELLETEQDLATALWELDLAHVEYEAVDPFLSGGDDVRSELLADLGQAVARALGELSTGLSEGTVGLAGEAGPGALASSDQGVREGRQSADPEEALLSDLELDAMDQLVAKGSPVLDEFALVLLEILGKEVQVSSGEKVLVRSLSLVMERYVEQGDLERLEFVVNHLKGLEARGRRPAGFTTEVVKSAFSREALSDLLARLSDPTSEEADRVRRFLLSMGDCLHPVLLEVLTESDNRDVRRLILGLFHASGGVASHHLLPLLRDARWYVVRNAVQLVGESRDATGDPEVTSQLESLLHHPDVRVRREVVRTLSSSGEIRAASLLARALQDEDSSVRTLAVRGLSRHPARGYFSVLLEQVENRTFDGRPPEEIQAFLDVLAVMGGEAAVEVLSKLWKRRMFGTRALGVRIAAVQALALARTPSALASLQEAARSGEAQIQRVAQRALREGRSLASTEL